MMTGRPLLWTASAIPQSKVFPVPPPVLSPLMDVSSKIAIGSDVTLPTIPDATSSDDRDSPSFPSSISMTLRAGTPKLLEFAASMPSLPCNWTMSSPHSSTVRLTTSSGWFWNTPTTSGTRDALSSALDLAMRAVTAEPFSATSSNFTLSSRSPNRLTAATISFACSAVTFLLLFSANITPMSDAPDLQATSASSAFVIPQTLTTFVPAVYAPPDTDCDDA
mmetsp:Transcript_24173/g.55296  ORF Transcript_24173/g.55296 Transcript_24173/m.55296 type:complete len:221 (+) Transcript_24173:1066-1728(+)